MSSSSASAVACRRQLLSGEYLHEGDFKLLVQQVLDPLSIAARAEEIRDDEWPGRVVGNRPRSRAARG